MSCPLCRSLEARFQVTWSEFVEARSLASYRMSNKSAAYLHVEMERAKSEFEEHRLVCLSGSQSFDKEQTPAAIRVDVRAVARRPAAQSAA